MEPAASPVSLSLVVPVKDERENLRPLVEEVRLEMDLLGSSYELIFVDDGSTDGSTELIRRLAEDDPRIRMVILDENHGQSAAFHAGFERAQGEVVVTLDADLQNDPHDIGSLLEALARCDLAIGVRTRRSDSWLRRVSSRIANAARSVVTGDRIQDIGCSLKAFRSPLLTEIPAFSGMHRFYPTLARMHGFRVVEVPVTHRPRRAGRSKYGIANRIGVTIVDLLAVRWMASRRFRYRVVEESPMDREVREETTETVS